jgi:hypothetical protein
MTPQHLRPVATRVRDVGLVYLVSLRRLTDLGLRDDRITEAAHRRIGMPVHWTD